MSLPTVVIIGRPNVGKSSLFNRILGRRQAIVDDQPGVTRDRIYAQTEWAGKPFALIDTGGLLPSTKDPIMEAVKEQVEFAASEASRILFLVDWETGVTDLDLAIAKYLHRLGKSVLVVVNKVDDEKREQDIKDFHQLGFDQPIYLSALRGRGIGDLLDQVVDFPIAERAETDSGLRIAIVGRPNVGKSSIVNALTGQRTVVVSEIPGTTRDAIDTAIRYQGETIILVDTAGLRRRGKSKQAVEFYSQLRTARAMECCDVAWIVLDAEEGIVSSDQQIIADAYTQGRGILILVNKWDTVQKDHRTSKEWETQLKEVLGSYNHLPVLFVSAVKRQRLLKALDTSRKVNADRTRRISTSKLNNTLIPIIKRSPPPSTKGRYIQIKYITQIKTAPPLIAFFCNHPELIGKGYRRFLERTLRQEFEFTGVPIRLAFRKK